MVHKKAKLENGQEVTVYYETVRLTPNDLSRLAALAVGHLDDGAFDVAIAVGLGGTFFSFAVAGGREVGILTQDGKIHGPSVRNKRVVLVSDVVHTGHQLSLARSMVEGLGAKVVGGACVVDRSIGRLVEFSEPLWSSFQI